MFSNQKNLEQNYLQFWNNHCTVSHMECLVTNGKLTNLLRD